MASGDAAQQRWTFVAPRATAAAIAQGSPTFSVVIPAYDAGAALVHAVRSALMQSAPPLEVIVVDDGSPDDVPAALASFGAAVRVVRIPHGGVSTARNAGVREAAGDFVAFLDADDVYAPDFLAALGELARERPDLDVLTTDTRFVADGMPRDTFYAANRFPVDDQRSEILRRCWLTMTSAARRTRLLEIGGFDEKLTYGEDWDLWLRLVVSGSQVGLVAAPLSRYRMSPQQATARRAESLWGRVHVLEKALRSSQLTADERSAARRVLGELRARAALASAARAGTRMAWLRAAGPARRRRRWLRIAVVGVVAPGRARRRAAAAGVISASSPR